MNDCMILTIPDQVKEKNEMFAAIGGNYYIEPSFTPTGVKNMSISAKMFTLILI
ncbi:hypothetical protein ACS127_01730 [Amphibacillus sp. Q70]|uniref:hypothetical protein n=1 Tax=Amphibacillus sp. Q70 TaxID=3453416 RepID=UPI003F858C9F